MELLKSLESDVNQWFVDNAEFGISYFVSAQIQGDFLKVEYCDNGEADGLDLPLSQCSDSSAAFQAFKEYYLNAHFARLRYGA